MVKPGDTLLETCITISLMCKYGWERVRGGSYCNVEMQKAPACITKAMHYATYKTNNTQEIVIDTSENAKEDFPIDDRSRQK